MAKRFKKLKVDVELLIVDNGTPHGFLNMQSLSSETHDAFDECMKYLKEIIQCFDNSNSNSTSLKSSNSSGHENIDHLATKDYHQHTRSSSTNSTNGTNS